MSQSSFDQIAIGKIKHLALRTNILNLKSSTGFRLHFWLVLIAAIILIISNQTKLNAEEIHEILEATGISRGLCLVVDEPNAKLTTGFAKSSQMYVQSCMVNSEHVFVSRKELVAAGIIHRASVIVREDDHLPYNDNLINLVVVPNWKPGKLDIKEVVRVLTPGGMAAIGGTSQDLDADLTFIQIIKGTSTPSQEWSIFRKPIHSGLGDWTHMKGGADQSYVSNDSVVAPWKEIQWIGDPRWGSLYSSYGGFVSAGGRIYYKESRAADGGNQWHLVARDAFNGTELWRIDSGNVWKKTWAYTDYTLTCDESRVFLVEDETAKFPFYNGKLVARDGETGKLLKEYTLKFPPRTVTSSSSFLIASARNRVEAIEKSSGDVVWSGFSHGHPAAVNGHIFVVYEGALTMIDLTNGKTIWKSQVKGLPVKPRNAMKIVVMHKGDVVYVVNFDQYRPEGQVAAFEVAKGRFLWNNKQKFSHGVLPFQDEVWCMDRDNKSKTDNMHALVLDSLTGKTKRDFNVKGSVMGKCWGARATSNQIMYSNGWFLDRRTGESAGNPNTRSPCRIGQNPANGLTYFLPHHCDCKVTIRGFLALGKPGTRTWLREGKEEGDYKLFSTDNRFVTEVYQSDDWPVYRKDSQRSNATQASISSPLKTLWNYKLGKTKLTQSTIAYGRVFTAEQQAGHVFCRDAKTGQELWSFVSDGRIEFPPTLYSGVCLVATCAGTVYGLNAKNGRELWKLRAAPVQKFIGDRNQFASSWPVIGGVLVFNTVAYFSVGRTQSQLGGLWLYAVEPATGKVLWRVKSGSSGDMFVADDKYLTHTARAYDPTNGKWLWKWKPSEGMLRTTRYLSTVSIADYIATVDPNPSHKKHIELTDGRVSGDCICFNDQISVAGWRYTPGTPGWKNKENTNKYFVHAKGAYQWNLHDVDQHMRSIVLAGGEAYAVGVPTSHNPDDASELWVLSTIDGSKQQTITLKNQPVYDGLSVAGGRLYLSTAEGDLICFGNE